MTFSTFPASKSTQSTVALLNSKKVAFKLRIFPIWSEEAWRMFLLYTSISIFAIFLLDAPTIYCQSSDCKLELNLLADSVSNFTRCAVNQASPFKFCRLCYQEFDTVRNVKRIVYDKHYDCVKELVESERYQIVKRVYDFANHLWEGSYCYNCFSSDNKDVANIGEPWTFKSDVVDFFYQQDLVNQCFMNHTEIPSHSVSPSNKTDVTISNVTDTHIVCSKCHSYYDDLNAAYYDIIDDMGTYAEENVLCADVVSAMNVTRQRWSHQFNCVKVNRDTVSVVALTVLFCFFPIVFYTAAKLHGDINDKKTSVAIPQINYNSAE